MPGYEERAALTAPSKTEYALNYSRRGWKVIPLHSLLNGICSCGRPDCQSKGKHPLTKSGLKDGATDEAKIREWWVQNQDANIGIVTGEESGIFVLDVDAGSGGYESLTILEAAHGPLPITLTANTGGGGKHFLFRHPGIRVRNSVKSLGDGLDIRGDGGYIVAAPSNHKSGNLYGWVDPDQEISEAPEWLLDLVTKKQPETPTTAPIINLAPVTTSQEQYGRKALLAACEAISNAAKGSRNQTLNEEAFGIGQLIGSGAIPTTEAEGSLIQAARACGLNEGEALKTIHSGLNSGLKSPRNLSNIGKAETLIYAKENAMNAQPNFDQYGDDEEGVYEFLSIEDLRNLPPPTWLIDQYIEDNSLAVIFGESNGGKTFVALDMALSVASGMRWDNRDTGKGRVVYIAAEGKSGLSKRVDAWLSNRNPGGGTEIDFLPLPINLYEGDEKKLIRTIERLPSKPVLVVIDTLARCFEGGEENSSKDMGKFIAACDRIRNETGAAVMVIHHTGKNGETERGSSALKSAVSTMIKITPKESQHSSFTIKCTKQKEAEWFPETNWNLSEVIIPAGTSCVPVRDIQDAASSSEQIEKRYKISGKQRLVLDEVLLKPDGITKDEIQANTDIKTTTLRDSLDALKGKNLIAFNKLDKKYRPLKTAYGVRSPLGEGEPSVSPFIAENGKEKTVRQNIRQMARDTELSPSGITKKTELKTETESEYDMAKKRSQIRQSVTSNLTVLPATGTEGIDQPWDGSL